MNIELDNGQWITDNGYLISGDVKNGYIVYENDGQDEENNIPVYHSDDFESVITWCYNS